MRRYVSVFLPTLPTDRWRRRNRTAAPPGAPFVLTASGAGGDRLAAVDAAARAAGLGAGMTLADARALVPELRAAPADPRADAAALARLAGWCDRYTPLAAADGTDGLVLDVTGCAHLLGGEAALLADLTTRLARSGLTARAGLADTPAAAWAWARFRPPCRGAGPILPAGGGRAELAGLPVPALRLPKDAVDALRRVGLRALGDLLPLPRAPLIRRFGPSVGRRLDALFDSAREPVAWSRPPVPFAARLAFAEPIGGRDDLEAALGRLLVDLCRRLEEAGRGARRLTLALVRTDAAGQTLAVGAARPSHDPLHLARLFRDRLDRIDLGFGVEAMTLTAGGIERAAPRQAAFDDPGRGVDLARLADRLRARAGAGAVLRPVPADGHAPERAAGTRPFEDGPAAGATEADAAGRPVVLLDPPEPLEVEALVPGGPPVSFRRRGRVHRVGRSEGPERVRPEWWRDGREPAAGRDYYRVETLDGRRLWLFRVPAPDGAAWFLHGLFA